MRIDVALRRRAPVRGRRGAFARRGVVTAMAGVAAFLAMPAVGASAQPVPTVTTLAPSSVDPSVTGQPVTITASVVTATASQPVTGFVAFTFVRSDRRSAHVICQSGSTKVATTGGTAFCTVSSGLLAATSPYYVSAEFLATSTDSSSLSAPRTQTVHPAPTTVSVTTSATRDVSLSGCNLTETSSTVTCSHYLAQTAVGALVTGGAPLAPGTHVTAVTNTGSPSTATITIAPVALATVTAVTLTFTIDPDGTITSGSPVHYTATVAAAAPGAGQPTGWVTWTIEGAHGPSVVCANGTPVRLSRSPTISTCVVPTGVLLAAGSPYSVVATYSGSPDFLTSSASLTPTQSVTSASTKTYIAASPLPPKPGALVRITAAVEPSRYATTPAGSVTFSFELRKTTGSVVTPGLTCEGGSDTIALTPGGATCILATGLTVAGTYAIAVTYSGGPGDEPSGTCPVTKTLPKPETCPSGIPRSLKISVR